MNDGAAHARPMSSAERAVVARVLDGYTGPGAAQLRGQLDHDLAVTGPCTMLEIHVPEGTVARSTVADGPLRVRAIVEPPRSDGPVGELPLWVRDGALSALEYAWVSDEPPRALPNPDDIRVTPPDLTDRS